MEHVKLFYNKDHSTEELEKRVNRWLKKSGRIQITRVLQNTWSQGYNQHMIITIFYKITEPPFLEEQEHLCG